MLLERIAFFLFSSQSNLFPYSSLTEQLREPNEIPNSYENNEIDPQSETWLTLEAHAVHFHGCIAATVTALPFLSV